MHDACLDVVEVDAASRRRVEETSELLSTVGYLPIEVRHKVYVIDEVHMLSAHAFNSLLKTLEEPPEHVLFVLATTEVHKVPATVVSRCQRFDFRRIGFGELLALVREVAAEEGLEADEELRTFKQRRNIVDLDEESKAHIEVMAKLEAAAAETQAEIRPVESRLEVMKEALSQQERVLVSSTDIERNPLVVELQSRLAELETEWAGATDRYTEADPETKAILARMEEVRTQLGQEVATVIKRETKSINPLHQDFLAKVADRTAEFLALQAREKGLRRAIRSHEAALAGVPSDQVQLARLTRAVSVAAFVSSKYSIRSCQPYQT